MVIEKISSRSRTRGESRSITLEYAVLGSLDDAAAEAEFLLAIPASYSGLPLQETTLDPVGTIGGGFLWDATATYGRPESEDPEAPTVTFETGGGTQHIQQSIQTVGTYPLSSRTAQNYHGAIGVTKDSVEGVDIVVPNFQWSEEYTFAAAAVTAGYIETLENTTGKTNADAFRNRAIGEVLFMGASGNKSDASTWKISFKFAASKNVSGVSIGGISGVAKGGWEYLWASYEDFKDELAVPPKLVKWPIAVYVEQVYHSASFSALGIGS